MPSFRASTDSSADGNHILLDPSVFHLCQQVNSLPPLTTLLHGTDACAIGYCIRFYADNIHLTQQQQGTVPFLSLFECTDRGRHSEKHSHHSDSATMHPRPRTIDEASWKHVQEWRKPQQYGSTGSKCVGLESKGKLLGHKLKHERSTVARPLEVIKWN